MKRGSVILLGLWVVMLNSRPSLGASWDTCNGTPLRVKYAPMGLFWDQCSIPEGSTQERAFFSGLYETMHYVTALGFGSGFTRIDNGRCIIIA